MELQEESSKAVIIFFNQRQIGKTQLWAQGLNKWNYKDPQSSFNFVRSLGKWQHFTHAFRNERMNIQFAFNPECSDGVWSCSGNDPCNSRAEICKPSSPLPIFPSFLVLGFICSVWVVLWVFFLCLFLKARVLKCKFKSHVLGVFFLGKWCALSLGASRGRGKVHWFYWRAYWGQTFRRL